MNARDALRRLRAHEAGQPLPRGERLSIRIADPGDILIVAFVRTGGESRPWGIALGHPEEKPRYLTVPEGRDRDLVAAMALEFGDVLLRHLRSPALAHPAPAGEEGLAPIRQIWLPNASHVEMLHHLAFAYTFTMAGEESNAALRALGRACSWLFREAQVPGQQHVILGTKALKDAFTFPTEDVRQGHLGFLLAWLETDGDGESRFQAAMEAERRSVSTTLDPSVERDPLEPLVAAWREGDRRPDSAMARKITRVLEGELERRFKLTEEAWRLLRADARRENAGVEQLVKRGLKRQWRDWASTEAKIVAGETPFIPSVETDRQSVGAAMAFLRQSAADEFLKATLIHDDSELLAEAIADGNAFGGEIAAVRDEGVGKTTTPVWTLKDLAGGPLRLREESTVCVVGLPRRQGRIRSITTNGDGDRLIDIELTNLKTAIKGGTGIQGVHPREDAWIGARLTFASASASGIEEAKIKKLWDKTVPGAWLTHAGTGSRSLLDANDDDGEVAVVG